MTIPPKPDSSAVPLTPGQVAEDPVQRKKSELLAAIEKADSETLDRMLKATKAARGVVPHLLGSDELPSPKPSTTRASVAGGGLLSSLNTLRSKEGLDAVGASKKP
jgi:hypothetical protein